MFNFFKFNKHNTIGMIVSIMVFLIISFLFRYSQQIENFEKSSISFRFNMRDPFKKPVKLGEGAKVYTKNARVNEDIMIFGIDEDTIRDFNGIGINWPFPRDVHAKFINFVGTGNPSAIMMDIMFLDQKKGDETLANAMKKAGNVFIDYSFEVREADTKYADIDKRMDILNKATFNIDPNDTQTAWVEEAVPPTPMFSEAAAGLGYANVLADEDHVNRKMPLIVKFQGKYYPSIDLVVVMKYFGIGMNDVEIRIGKYIKLKNIPAEKIKKPVPDNTITIPIDKRGFMNINFVGSHGSFFSIPYSYYYADGELDDASKQAIKNKIILVAAYAVTGIAEDTHDSPYGKTFGIEHHANAINTIINQDFLYNFSDMQNIIIFLIIAVILGFLLPRIKIILSMIMAVSFCILYTVFAYLLFDINNYIIALSTPIFQIALTFTATIAFRLLTEQKEKKMIRNTFSKFVSKSVVDELLKHPEKVKLGGDKKIITVLFSDVRGFTSISERLTAEELVEHLNEYLQSMTDIVIQSNGTLDKYVGDELMAFWGAPIPQEDHHLRACKAALEMMSVLGRLNQHWEDTNKPPLDIGIGINTGDMVVGNMGSNSRMDYTIMGDNVNLGARLEGTNKIYGTNIIISEFTYEYVKDHIFARELDLIRVKGKEKPVKIYELIDVIS